MKKKMFKRIAALLAALIMVLSFAGCGGSLGSVSDLINQEDLEKAKEFISDMNSALTEMGGMAEDAIGGAVNGIADRYGAGDDSDQRSYTRYYFRNHQLLEQHYKKHGIDMGFSSAEEYERAASDVINDPDALWKEEAEDGDLCYYIEDSNEFVVLSTDGYIRTYFCPDAGKAYFDRQ